MSMFLVIPLFIGTGELLLISGVVLLLFGGKKLPELMKGLGQGVQSFKQGMSEPLPKNETPKKEENEMPVNQEPVENLENKFVIPDEKVGNPEVSGKQSESKA